MAEDTQTRKLATIVALDVAGYSARTEADEARTTAEVAALRKVIEGIAGKHGGRVFNTAGDGFMLEFGSSLAAVEAAAELAATCEPKVRVGVHLGDVAVQSNGDLLGHGVNVAARLMAKSEPGGALVSGAVRQSIRGPVAERLVSRGSMQLDKMAETIEAFALEAIIVSETGGPQAAPRKLSICVLPFANMSDDPQQEYFSDGISEDIITDLSKVSALAVVSRNSSFMYKGKHVDLPKVARELKVSHVLEGSVRKAGGRLRITAQLIDGVTNDHVWAERYDRDLNDIFALQDEISQAIVKALKLKLLPEEKKAIEKRGTDSVEAYNLYQMARQIYLTGSVTTARGSEAVIRLCNGAVNVDPNYARAWGLMALAMTIRATVTGRSADDGLAVAERALSLDPCLPEAHAAKGRFLANRGDFKGAWIEINEALRLDPSSYESHLVAGFVYGQEGKIEVGIQSFLKAAEIAPTNSHPFGSLISFCSMMGDKVRARQYAERALPLALAELGREADNGMAMGQAALSLAVLEQPERVKEVISRGLLLDPDNEIMKFYFLRANAMLGDKEATIAMLDIVLSQSPAYLVQSEKANPILDFIRDDPRVNAMFAAAEARLAGAT